MAALPEAPPVYYPKASISAIEYRWDPPANNNDDPAILYELAVSPGSNYTINSPFTRFSFPVPTAYEVYSATVRASNSTGWGPTSDFRDIHAADKPGGPSNVTVTVESLTSVNVTWDTANTDGGAPIQWQVVKLIDGETKEIVQKLPSYSNDTFKFINNLTTSNVYEVLVQSVNDVGYSPTTSKTPLFITTPLPSPYVYFSAATYSNGEGTWTDLGSNAFVASIESGTPQQNATSNGVVFNGSTHWQIPDIGPLNGVFTLSVWYKDYGTNPYTSGTPCILCTQFVPVVPIEIALVFNLVPNSLTFGAFYPIAWQTVDPGTTLTSNVWTNITVTLDGTTMTLYKDSVIVGSNAYINYGSGFYNGLPMNIGKRWDLDEYISGEVGTIRIYTSALTPSEVQALYTLEKPLF
jgi:hypothetical protein